MGGTEEILSSGNNSSVSATLSSVAEIFQVSGTKATFCSAVARPPLLFFRYWGMRTFQPLTTAVAISLLLFFFSSTTVAQDKRWSVGLKGGSTLSQVAGTRENIVSENPTIASLLRYIGGLSVQYLTEDNFGLQVEFNYTQKGWEEEYRNSDGRIPGKFYRVSLDYAEVPILAHAYFGKKNTRIFLNAGTYLAYLLSADTKRANVTDSEITYLYERRYQNKFDFGVRGGGGFEVVTRIGVFQAEGSYNWGINSIMDKGISQIPNILQNSTIAITLGYYVQF